ncbi:uncharacterized protein TRIADDRAFT_52004 [Trichoplax adhaerens]|uniref:FAD-dependent oxidoreductase domain-containing protein 1 n=1 Tax=Trichoplax adhaerens TaxID=10228 RepID=B3RLH7_TRIAD|nr:hypothetical protein TRIADDRAFT_52004 [Trichoplax adhaerens]EDV29539.1 hypothetical protein TRIADDRAFT_52004 [Trichoplax adhaerens]|eukprot:XP_002108741.1 hypothetical protein TRIADDRAFT_52004 [Trichoplax adhaerens]
MASRLLHSSIKSLNKSMLARWGKHLSSLPSDQFDVVIAGGGIMGLTTAYFLAKRIDPTKICVIERDNKYEKASTPLSCGSIRQQFSVPENIMMSKFGYDFISKCNQYLKVEDDDDLDIQFRNAPYVYLVDENREKLLRENYDVQRSMGAAVKLLSKKELSQIFPWINTDGIAIASLGLENEGSFDPYSFLQCMRKKVVAMSVRYLNGEVVDIMRNQKEIAGIEVKMNEDNHKESIKCRYLVNACGPWAGHIASMAGIGSEKDGLMSVSLPVQPAKRYVYVYDCPTGPKSTPAVTVDSSGTYFRRECSGYYICGRSPSAEQEPKCDNLDCDFEYFYDELWEFLAQRVPAFESLKIVGGWGGFYDYNTVDQNAIIGAHPVLQNFYFINGFSGHGIQQSPAAGRAISELIIDGKFTSIDLTRLGFDRILKNSPLNETNVI